MAENTFDLVIIGGGPAGYVGAIRASQLGLKTACVEMRPALGGTCLNVGCIPSKCLLESSEHYHNALENLSTHGVVVGKVSLNLDTMQKRKEQVVNDTTKGVAFLLKKNGVEHFEGKGRIVSATQVEVTAHEMGEEVPTANTQMLTARKILIATGSEPTPLPMAPFDGKRIISSTEALNLNSPPKHLLVIGAGVIGLELGSVWLRLGSQVSVFEMFPKICGNLDPQLSKMAQRSFERQGFHFHLGVKVVAVNTTADSVTVVAEDFKGKRFERTGDVLLTSIGRRPYCDSLGAAVVGVKFDDRKRIVTDPHYQTSVPGIYAVGDVIAGPMLAHKASEEAIAAIEGMVKGYGHMCYDAIPFVVYTWPEIAWVGKGEEELKQEGRAYKVGSYPFSACPRARTMAEKEGMVKILADAKTDTLLGVLIFGARASDMIAEAAVAVEFGASAEDLARSVHAHPTLAEAVKEAALAVDKRAIHM